MCEFCCAVWYPDEVTSRHRVPTWKEWSNSGAAHAAPVPSDCCGVWYPDEVTSRHRVSTWKECSNSARPTLHQSPVTAVVCGRSRLSTSPQEGTSCLSGHGASARCLLTLLPALPMHLHVEHYKHLHFFYTKPTAAPPAKLQPSLRPRNAPQARPADTLLVEY